MDWFVRKLTITNCDAMIAFLSSPHKWSDNIFYRPPVWLFWSGATGYPTSKGAAVTKLCRDNWESSAVTFAIMIIETSSGNTIFVTPLLAFRKIFLEHQLIVACFRSVRQFYIFHFMLKTNYDFLLSSQMRWGNTKLKVCFYKASNYCINAIKRFQRGVLSGFYH